MSIKQYDDPQDVINDARLAFCPRCWESTEQTVRVGQPFETPERQTLRAMLHVCRHCGNEAETHFAGRRDGVLYSGTWLDWEQSGVTIGPLAHLRAIRRSRGR